MIWMWVLPVFFIIILIFCILFSRIYLRCHFTYTQQKQVLKISVYFYRIRLLQREVDLGNNEKSDKWDNLWKDKSFLQGLRDIQKECREALQQIRELNTLSTLFLKKIRFHKLSWHTHAGTGEASTTGVATGLIWTIKGLLIGFVSKQSNLHCQPNTTVQPYFQFKYIQSTVDCIVSIKIGQAIIVFLKAMRKISNKKEALV